MEVVTLQVTMQIQQTQIGALWSTEGLGGAALPVTYYEDKVVESEVVKKVK